MPETDLDLLINAARQASKIALRYWRTEQRVDEKQGGSPVSEGDYAVDTFLKETLLAARPDYGWLSEETEDDPARLTRQRVFIVDPIDGTRSYVAGERTWAHSLAIVENGQPIAAVVYLPVRDKLYTAAIGAGAQLNGQAISNSGRDTPDGARILAPRQSLDAQWWTGQVPQFERHFRPSLAYRFCLVAEGRFDAMLTLRDAWEWDIAAGALIASEAKAPVTDRLGADLRLNSAKGKAKGILTCNAKLHAAILQQL